MRIDSETARIMYLPESRLYAHLESTYTSELEWRANGNPHELAASELAAELQSDQYDPLDHDWNGLEDSDLSPLWADLGYPLPSDADEVAYEVYGITPSDIVREALREYAAMYDVEALAAAVLDRLRAAYDSDNSSGSSCSSN